MTFDKRHFGLFSLVKLKVSSKIRVTIVTKES